MAVEISRNYIEEIAFENKQFGMSFSSAITGVEEGWKSFLMTKEETAQVQLQLIGRNEASTDFEASKLHGRLCYYLKEITGMVPDDIDHIMSEGDVLTIVPFNPA